MRTTSQKGEGKVGSIVSLLVLLAVIYAAWNVAPAYVANYGLKDKMNEVARSPRGTTNDEKILDMLDTYVLVRATGERRPHRQAALYHLAIRCGLRKGELVGRTATDADPNLSDWFDPGL